MTYVEDTHHEPLHTSQTDVALRRVYKMGRKMHTGWQTVIHAIKQNLNKWFKFTSRRVANCARGCLHHRVFPRTAHHGGPVGIGYDSGCVVDRSLIAVQFFCPENNAIRSCSAKFRRKKKAMQNGMESADRKQQLSFKPLFQ